MTQPISHLQCIACSAGFDARETRYRCDCGDLLQVTHDLEQVRRRWPDLKERFAQRVGRFDLPHASGVWRYHELILPDLPAEEIITKPEGNTNLYRSAALSDAFNTQNLFIKHEGENPTLSFKDRGMTAGVSWANHLGLKRVACASTGDTSAALAAYAAQAPGMRGIVFLPAGKISNEQLAQALCAGATTLAIDTDFDGCMKLVVEICATHRIYLLNSMNSFRIEGQKAIGLETLQQLDWRVPDWFVIPVGNAGNISALGKGLAEARELGLIDRLPRIAGVQAAAADPLYRSYQSGFAERTTVTAQPTAASAIRIGDPVSRDKASRVIQQFNGVMESVSEAELMDAKARADRAGVFVCPNSGVALAGLLKLRDSGAIGPDETVVVIATAHGLKFSQVSTDYHTGALKDPKPAHPNAPIQVPARFDAIEQALQLGNSTRDQRSRG